MNKYQKTEAKNWKNASIKSGILACKRWTLEQAYNDLILCQRSDKQYVEKTLALL